MNSQPNNSWVLKGDDVARFREINLLSAAAVLRGQCSLKGPVDLWWARDDFIGTPSVSFFATNNLVKEALAEKAEAVGMWKQIEMLVQQIRFPDAQTKEFAVTSAAYGRIKYSLFEQAWVVLCYGATGDRVGKYDCERLSAAISAYDQLWREWRALKEAHPSCATLYKDVAFQNRPGIGATVDKYRKTCAAAK